MRRTFRFKMLFIMLNFINTSTFKICNLKKIAVCAVSSVTFLNNFYPVSPSNAVTISEASANYRSIIKNGNPREIFEANRKLLDYVFGTTTTMFYDPTGGEKFEDNQEWRSKWKGIESRGKFIFSSVDATQNQIRSLIEGIGDKYSFYASPQDISPPDIVNNHFRFISSSNTASEGLKSSVGIEVKAMPPNKNNIIPAVEVIAVRGESSSERAGLKVGDLIVEVEGIDIRRISSAPILDSMAIFPFISKPVSAAGPVRESHFLENRIKSLLEGDYGSSVRLGILPRSRFFSSIVDNPKQSLSLDEYSHRPYHISLTRDVRPISSSSLFVEMSSELKIREIKDPSLNPEETVAYIRMHSFSPATSSALIEALSSSPVLRHASLLLLDLRNNFGGVLQDAMLDASLFLDDKEKVLCYTVTPRGVAIHDVDEWREDPRRQSLVEEEGLSNRYMKEVPIGILVNEGTASAAELFAAALRDNDRAVLIGSRTFGKGLIQHIFPLPDGGLMKLTVAEYLTPKRQHILPNVESGMSGGGGLTPDVYCNDQPTDIVWRDLCVGVAIDAVL